MVGEFPELQGLMGGYYALAQGEDPEVAEAIRDHYKPVGQGDDVPTAPVTVAVSLADKLDTLTGFFAESLLPTGSRDPFALRRAALGVIATILDNRLRIDLSRPMNLSIALGAGSRAGADVAKRVDAMFFAKEALGYEIDKAEYEDVKTFALNRLLSDEARVAFHGQVILPVRTALLDFFADRLKVQQREAGVRHDLIDAVFALGGEDDLVRLLARVNALQAFVGTPDGTNLLAGYKRAANILKKEGVAFSAPVPESEGPGVGRPEGEGHVASATTSPLSYTPEKAEGDLIAALDHAAPRAQAAVAREDFEGAMAALASLRAPIDAFFETVTVNDPDPEKRTARLALLARVRAAVHAVADFSKIEG